MNLRSRKQINRFERIFVTVGTTEFRELLDIVLDNLDFIESLVKLGCKEFIVQIGRSSRVPEDAAKIKYSEHGIAFSWYRFKDSLLDDYSSADLVISHAGSGTILEVLRLNKKLITCVNETLQGNHQTELADAVSTMKYCIAIVPNGLVKCLQNLNFDDRVPFPTPDYKLCPKLIDDLFA